MGRLSNPVQRRLDRAGVEDPVGRYLAGATIAGLAELFGVHRTTVAAHRDRADVPRRRRPGWGDSTLVEARAMYGSGAPFADHGSSDSQ